MLVLNRSHTLEGVNLKVFEKKAENDDEQSDDEKHNDDDDTAAEHVNRMMAVSGFKPSTNEEMLTMYFENTRKSGGGDIKEIDVNADKQQATITFVDDPGINIIMIIPNRFT